MQVKQSEAPVDVNQIIQTLLVEFLLNTSLWDRVPDSNSGNMNT